MNKTESHHQHVKSFFFDECDFDPDVTDSSDDFFIETPFRDPTKSGLSDSSRPFLDGFSISTEITKACRALLPETTPLVFDIKTDVRHERYNIVGVSCIPRVTIDEMRTRTKVREFEHIRQTYLPGGRQAMSSGFVFALAMRDGLEFGFAAPCTFDSNSVVFVLTPTFYAWFSMMKELGVHNLRDISNWNRYISMLSYHRKTLKNVTCRWKDGTQDFHEVWLLTPDTRKGKSVFSYYNFNPARLRLTASVTCHVCQFTGLRKIFAGTLPADSSRDSVISLSKSKFQTMIEKMCAKVASLSEKGLDKDRGDLVEKRDELIEVSERFAQAGANAVIELASAMRRVEQLENELDFEKKKTSELTAALSLARCGVETDAFPSVKQTELDAFCKKYNVNVKSTSDTVQNLINVVTSLYGYLDWTVETLCKLPTNRTASEALDKACLGRTKPADTTKRDVARSGCKRERSGLYKTTCSIEEAPENANSQENEEEQDDALIEQFCQDLMEYRD